MRFLRSARFSVWVAFAVLVGLGAPLLSSASEGSSWISVSTPVPMRIGGLPGTLLLSPRELAEARRGFVDSAVEAAASALSAAGQVTVKVSVRDPNAAEREVIRVAGADRYGTALEASSAFLGGAQTVVIATGANWPDALGGSALVGAVSGPLLLTRPEALPGAVRAEIERLGATKAYILGGTRAVGPAVEQELVRMLGSSGVVRLGGADRYATARLIADETIRILGSGYSGDALVATGSNFPDAVSGAALAAALRRPILLVNTAGQVYVPAATRRVTILGGPAAVSPAVQAALQRGLGASSVKRAGGATRYHTAALVAQVGIAAGMTWDGVGVATGTNFPDALSGGAMLGARGSVLLLTTPGSLSPEAEALLLANRDSVNTVHILGGTQAVSSAVEDAVRRSTGIF
jgi:putative cell wall-binding protein